MRHGAEQATRCALQALAFVLDAASVHFVQPLVAAFRHLGEACAGRPQGLLEVGFERCHNKIVFAREVVIKRTLWRTCCIGDLLYASRMAAKNTQPLERRRNEASPHRLGFFKTTGHIYGFLCKAVPAASIFAKRHRRFGMNPPFSFYNVCSMQKYNMKVFLGTGLLGTNFATAALRAGEQVGAWNRSPGKTQKLQEGGATIFASAAEAVAQASSVHLVLSDDAAVDDVMAAIADHIPQGVPVIDHTTTSVAGAVRRSRDWQAKGILFQHAPVFMSPQNALDRAGVMLFSGADADYSRLQPLLAPMTGKFVNLGEETGRAAALKLAGNLMLMAITTGLADATAFLKSLDIPRNALTGLFEHFDPGASVKPRSNRMVSGKYDDPSWELQMARKDARLILAEPQKNQVDLPAVRLYAQVMDRSIELGLGKLDWTVIGKDFLDP
jgi:3-hydroxyisobutyrate dehydrogenase